MHILLELLKLAAVGLIAGTFASMMANRDYRHRKWWELRANAYQKSIEALSDLVYYYEKQPQIFYAEHSHSDEEEEKHKTYWEEGFLQIRKSADSGTFLFSDEANASLRKFMDYEPDAEDDYLTHLDSRFTSAKECLSDLIKYSIVDLELKPNMLEKSLKCILNTGLIKKSRKFFNC